MVWALLILVGAAGILALALGLIGRRVNSHPICRRCGFDLIGVHGRSPVCSECGASLSRKRAVRPGQSVRRRRLVVVGSLLLGVAAGASGVLGWSAIAGFDWNTIKPAWLLVRELDQPDGIANGPVLNELARRMQAGTLDPDAAARAVDRALDAHACLGLQFDAHTFTDRSFRADLDAWIAFMDTALTTSHVSPGQAVRYVQQAIHPGFEARPAAAQDSTLPLHWYLCDNRGFLGRGGTVGLRPVLRSAALDGAPLALQGNTGPARPVWSSGMWLTAQAPIGADPGTYQLKLNWEVEVFRQGDAEPAGTYEHSESRPLRVLPAGTSPVQVVVDPDLAPRVARSVRVRGVVGTGSPGNGVLHVYFSFNQLPLTIAGDLILRRGDESWTIAYGITSEARDDRSWFRVPCSWPAGLDAAGPVEVVLVPRLGALLSETTAESMWGREVVAPGIELEVNPGAHRMEVLDAHGVLDPVDDER